jgi:hypothetical protein
LPAPALSDFRSPGREDLLSESPRLPDEPLLSRPF